MAPAAWAAGRLGPYADCLPLSYDPRWEIGGKIKFGERCFGESDTNKCRRDAEQTKRASDEAVVSGLMSENIH